MTEKESQAHRVFVLTVGTSWLGRAAAARRDPDNPREVPNRAETLINEPFGAFERGGRLSEEVMQGLRDYYVDYQSNGLLLSAELVTVRPGHSPSTADDKRIPVNAGDVVFLLASDTREGEYCARIDEACLGAIEGVDIRVRVLTEVAVDLEDTFERAAANALGGVLAEVWTCARERNAALSLHYNGGYKAMIPILFYLVGHLPQAGVAAEAFVQHEMSKKLIQIPVLTRGIPEALRVDLASVAEYGTCADGSWNGYAYRKNDEGAYDLTFLGQALTPLAELR